MKNKKGFTLVEILCVIVLLSVLTVYASANVINATRNGKSSLYCTKIKLIEGYAKDYGVNMLYDLNNSTEYYEGYKSKVIKVSDLIDNGFLDTDKGDMVISPIDNESMNDVEIILYLKNNNIYAHIDNKIC